MTTPSAVRPLRPTNGQPGPKGTPAQRGQWPAAWTGLIRRLFGLRPGQYVIVLHIEDNGPATWKIGAIGPDERRQ